MFGLLKENGPFQAGQDEMGEPSVSDNPYTWSRDHSMLYIDQPVGTGFSFTDHQEVGPLHCIFLLDTGQ